jgi:hypothetical protein
MTDFSSKTLAAEEKGIINDYPAPDASADRDVDQVTESPAGAKPVLTQGGKAGIIGQPNRGFYFLLQERLQRDIAQSGQIRREKQHPSPRVDQTGGSYPHAQHLFQIDV